MDTDGAREMLIEIDDENWTDAWDAYFPAPLSLSLVANTFAHNGMQRELAQLLDLHDSQVDAIGTDLVELHDGGRPRCTAIAHHSVPGQWEMHLHVHVYVTRTAVDPTTGERVLVERAGLAAAAATAWHRYSARLRERTTEVLSFGWDPLPDDAGGAVAGTDEVRVAGLPRAVQARGWEQCICHGYFGPHEQIMAEDHSGEGVGEITGAARPESG
jgi:hypothetical protein